MLVSKEWLIENFYFLNKDYFGGKLPFPQLVIDHSSSYLGQCSMRGHARKGSKTVPFYRITISNYRDRPEGDILNTLLHEMIHLYFYQKNMRVGHGPEFQRMARSFDKYGFNIQTVSKISSGIKPEFLHKHPMVLKPLRKKSKPKAESSNAMMNFGFYSLLAFVVYLFVTSDLSHFMFEIIKTLLI